MTGLFFGSFNPVHNGHLAIARYLLDNFYCREVWFVVSPQNPLKQDKSLLEERKRLEIVEVAIAGDSRLAVCDIEFMMSRPSYTIDTLQKLENNFPGKQFALIIGGDNLRDFHLWRNHDMIARRYPILVYPRPGIILPEKIWENLTLVDAPLSAISSTEIRGMLVLGEDISSYVPPQTADLIKKYYR